MREHGPTVGGGYGPPPPVAGPPGAGDWPIERREAWLQERITSGRTNGSLNRREASRAQSTLDDIKATQARMMRHSHGRLRDDDRERLNERLSRLSDMLRGERAPWAR